MANWNDLTDKMEKLVVEEKNWNDLPYEMKEMVIKEMTFETRTRLKACSKSDKQLVESIPISYDELYFRAVKDWYKNLNVTLDMESKLGLFLNITVKDQEVKIIRTPRSISLFLRCELEEYTKRIRCSSEEDGKQLVENIIRSVLFDGKFRFNKVNVFINAPGFLENVDFTIHAKHVTIYQLNSQTIDWLKKLAPKVESITSPADEWDRDDEVNGLGFIPAVMNAQKVEIEHYCDINDEQLANFKCTSLKISYLSNITGKGINQLIKKAIANDYPIGTHFEINNDHHYDNLCDSWEEISEGLDIEVTFSSDDSYDEEGDIEKYGLRNGVVQMEHDKQMTIYVCYGEFEAEIIEQS